MSHNHKMSSKRTSIDNLQNEAAKKIHLPDNDNKFKVMETPDKGEKDRKDYRLLKLNNGITALIISDPLPKNQQYLGSTNNKLNEDRANCGKDEINPIPSAIEIDCDEDEEEKDEEDEVDEDYDSTDSDEDKHSCGQSQMEKLAACSLCVNVGSSSDPRDIQGLAHFLEHMIFMGSKKFPIENEFDQYIKRSAGFDNASTDFEETTFCFEVAEIYLDGALDRFANLFKEPLMLKECMTREREAVESEFQTLFQREDVRREQLLSSLGNAEHPCSIFSWGNLKTLKDNLSDDELHRRVHEFQKRHYSAHRMFVCIQAPLPLDTIQSMVIEHFSEIPNNELPGEDHSKWNHLNAFQDIFSDKIFVVKPVGNVTKLDITFCVESLTKEYKTKPYDYISYLLGHEGKGSLTSYLRRKNWILDLEAGVDGHGFGINTLYSFFTITVFFTQMGMDHVKETLQAVFGFLKLISTLDPIITQTLYSELQTIEANNFRFQTDITPLDNVSNLVTNPKYFPPKDVLTGPKLFFEYDYNFIKNFLEKMKESKMNIMITTKTPFEEHEFDQIEPWYGTQYCSFDIPKDWLEAIKDPKIFDEFQLPESNTYIPKDLTILYNSKKTRIPKHPELIMQNDICELWYRQDDKFLLPMAHYHFYFRSPMAMGCIENAVLLPLYSMLLKYKVVEILYPATVVGLEYSTYPSEKGLILKVSGYSQNLHYLVETFLQKLISFADEVTEQEFNMFLEQQLKSYYNALINPKALAKSLRLSVIAKECYPTYEKYEAVKKLTLHDLKSYDSKFRQKMKIQGLFQGNLTRDTAKSVMEKVLTYLKAQPIDKPSSLDLRAHRIPRGAHYLRCASLNSNDVNTLTCNFYQMGETSMKTNSLIDLLIMIAEEPLFDLLRSKEQLGYNVSCTSHDDHGILGYSIIVNSQENKFSAEYIDERIEAFRTELLNIIRKEKAIEFEQYKESVIQIKLTEDNNLNEEICRNWTEITKNEYIFDRARREVDCVRKITKLEFLEFYENHLLVSNKFTVQVIGRSDVRWSEKSRNPQSDDDVPLTLLEKRVNQLTMIPMSTSGKGKCIENIQDFIWSLELYPVTKTFVYD